MQHQLGLSACPTSLTFPEFVCRDFYFPPRPCSRGVDGALPNMRKAQWAGECKQGRKSKHWDERTKEKGDDAGLRVFINIACKNGLSAP